MDNPTVESALKNRCFGCVKTHAFKIIFLLLLIPVCFFASIYYYRIALLETTQVTGMATTAVSADRATMQITNQTEGLSKELNSSFPVDVEKIFAKYGVTKENIYWQYRGSSGQYVLNVDFNSENIAQVGAVTSEIVGKYPKTDIQTYYDYMVSPTILEKLSSDAVANLKAKANSAAEKNGKKVALLSYSHCTTAVIDATATYDPDGCTPNSPYVYLPNSSQGKSKEKSVVVVVTGSASFSLF
jgi:hypothetical protein